MNKTKAKLVGAVKKLHKEHRSWNREMEDPNSLLQLDDGYYKFCERKLDNLGYEIEEQVRVLNAQLGRDGKDDILDWFKEVK